MGGLVSSSRMSVFPPHGELFSPTLTFSQRPWSNLAGQNVERTEGCCHRHLHNETGLFRGSPTSDRFPNRLIYKGIFLTVPPGTGSVPDMAPSSPSVPGVVGPGAGIPALPHGEPAPLLPGPLCGAALKCCSPEGSVSSVPTRSPLSHLGL